MLDASELPEELSGSLRSLGVDGCRGGWVGATLADDRFRWRLFAALDEIGPSLRRGAVCLVDIPIGLPSSERSERRCDRAARDELRPRRAASVFSPPCEAALNARDFPGALRINRQETGRGISLQAWHLLPKIREAAAWRGRALLRESHPEVCFARLSGEPARHPKRKREGREERLRFLESRDSSVRSSLAAARAEIGPSRAAVDDFLDAAILALAAAEPLETLPPDPGSCEPVLWLPRRAGQ